MKNKYFGFDFFIFSEVKTKAYSVNMTTVYSLKTDDFLNVLKLFPKDE